VKISTANKLLNDQYTTVEVIGAEPEKHAQQHEDRRTCQIAKVHEAAWCAQPFQRQPTDPAASEHRDCHSRLRVEYRRTL